MVSSSATSILLFLFLLIPPISHPPAILSLAHIFDNTTYFTAARPGYRHQYGVEFTYLNKEPADNDDRQSRRLATIFRACCRYSMVSRIESSCTDPPMIHQALCKVWFHRAEAQRLALDRMPQDCRGTSDTSTVQCKGASILSLRLTVAALTAPSPSCSPSKTAASPTSPPLFSAIDTIAPSVTHGRLCEPLLGVRYILLDPTNELILIVGNAAIRRE
ncbi:hypothetical protein HD553DRAFT_38232 [Filobasidium floriforme]|uniref:uncharacterized protein n=1 Tax=Filobasidium floriforme TaxID=5210 RepID=UPI001E8DBF11|nr:uncharacterized protein HD553DRAFT_38232 [Filobasidium floriforme]KAH8084045.1 hypothetical protein HD553DRAFT_38232 [Filobasidium floriforme]